MKLHRRSNRALRAQRGSVMIFVAVSLAACLAFAVLAIDVGAIFVTRVQLQNAADAAALAGASALLNADQDEATARAIAVAGENVALQDGPQPVVITEDDVTFPTASRCRVVTHRTEDTGDPLHTFFSPIVGVTDRLAQVTADAEAEYYLVCATDCVKPWSIPDRWQDLDGDGEFDYGDPYTDSNDNGQWDMGEPYDDENGDGQYTPDEPYDPVSTGYLPPADIGIRLMLKSGSPNDAIVPGFYYAVCLPPLHSPEGPPQSGGAVYEWNIANCNSSMVGVGDSLEVEPGNMQGPTNHGVNELVARDPDAYWDPATQTVQGSNFGTSPRVVKIAYFDPRFTPKSGRNYVIVTKMSAMFVEGLGPQNSVIGVFMDLGTQGSPCEGSEPGFLTGLRLVE